jgi:hypothetical protein
MDADGADNVPVAPEGTNRSQATKPMAATMHVAMTYRNGAFRSEILLLYVARERPAKSSNGRPLSVDSSPRVGAGDGGPRHPLTDSVRLQRSRWVPEVSQASGDSDAPVPYHHLTAI